MSSRRVVVVSLDVWMSFCTLLSIITLVVSTQIDHHQSYEASATTRNLKQEHMGIHEVHCSRERSRAAWEIIQEYLMPFVEKEKYQISNRCRLHRDNDLYRDQEEHKTHVDLNEWQCGYCKKRFYEEKYVDKHFDNRHYDLLNVNGSKCLADLCKALHCDQVMESVPRKARCNVAATAKSRHLCESLADTCFPVSEGPSSSRLHEFFLRQFCDAHTCGSGPKPFSRGRRKRRNTLYMIVSVFTLMLLALFYISFYLYKRGLRRPTVDFKRISKSGQKKKPY